MTERPIKNMAASIHQRLLNLAKQTGRPFNELLQYYGMERFLYRLAHSRHGEMRAIFGLHLARLCAAYGVDVEPELASIFPKSDEETEA